MQASKRVAGAAQANTARPVSVQRVLAPRAAPEAGGRLIVARTQVLERPTKTAQQEAPATTPAPRPPPKSGGGGHKGAGGPFAPLVVATRGVMGEKEFNKFRGKAISLHSQVIKEFGKLFGVENRQVQGVIRLAKKNGEWLGFLA